MAITFGSLTTTVLDRLGDANSKVWSYAEIQAYIKEGYDLLMLDTEVLWRQDVLEDEVFTGNYVGDWEVAYMDYFLDRFNNTGGDWEKDYVDNDVPTETSNHTAPWEWGYSYVTTDIVKAVSTLPEDLYKMERVTWDDRRIFPLEPIQLQRIDHLYETKRGTPRAYVMGRDGLRKIRKYPAPDTANALSMQGSWGVPRDLSDVTDDSVVGTWGTPREIGILFVSASSDWGTPRGLYLRANNLSIEYSRRGADLTEDDSVFEVHDRYVIYIRDYAMAKAMLRDSPGHDPELGRFFMQRFELEKERLRQRRHQANRSKVRVMGGPSRVRTKPAYPVLPEHYPRLPK